jgi:hypothetical protein
MASTYNLQIEDYFFYEDSQNALKVSNYIIKSTLRLVRALDRRTIDVDYPPLQAICPPQLRILGHAVE